MNWRPDGWKNPYSKESDPLHMANQEPNYTDFEDGADAMLETLKVCTARWDSKGLTFLIPNPEKYDEGFLIFIPIEEAQR